MTGLDLKFRRNLLGAFALALMSFLSACGSSKSGAPTAGTPQPLPTTTPTAISPANAQGGLGFYPANTQGIPFSVQNASDSVFKLLILGYSGESSVRFKDISNGRGAALKKEIDALPETSLSPQEKEVLKLQVAECEASNEIEVQKNCRIITELHQSTGFLAQKGSTLWMAAHAVEPALKLIQRGSQKSLESQLKSKQQIPIFIFNKAGKLVFNSFKEAAKIKTVPVVTNFARMTGKFYSADSDYISLDLSRSLGKPLPFAKKAAIPGDMIYAMGFPLCTACDFTGISGADPIDFADRAPAPNSDGKSQLVSFGKVLAPLNLETFFEMPAATMQLLELPYILFTTADSLGGLSGSPYLNSQGEVVAIVGGAKGRLEQGVQKRISRGAIPR